MADVHVELEELLFPIRLSSLRTSTSEEVLQEESNPLIEIV